MRISDHERSSLRYAVETALEPAQNINFLLRNVVLARIDQADNPICNLVTLLSQNSPYWLQQMDELCGRYLSALVNRDDALARVRDELLPEARASDPKPFNAKMAGFTAEMAAVGQLSARGYSHFVPMTRSDDYKTADYECRIDGASACLEVKNINSPFGIFDVFAEVLAEKKKESPYFNRVSLTLYCDDDNTATQIQEGEIKQFLNSMDNGPIPKMYDVSLSGGVKLRVEVQSGQGRFHMFRGFILGTVLNVQEDKFLGKIESTVTGALRQLAKCTHQRRVLALNIITPDAELPKRWNTEIRNIVYNLSGGAVHCEILFFHHYLEPNLDAGISTAMI